MYIISFRYEPQLGLWSRPSMPCRPHLQWWFSFLGIKAMIRVQENSVRHSCCQTERMFAWEFLASLLDKSQAVWVAEWLGTTKSCPQAFLYDELAETVWWARGLCSKPRSDCCPVSSTGLCVLRLSPWDAATARWDHVPWQRWTGWKLWCCSLWGWWAHPESKILVPEK